jgi:hypothetical protein
MTHTSWAFGQMIHHNIKGQLVPVLIPMNRTAQLIHTPPSVVSRLASLYKTLNPIWDELPGGELLIVEGYSTRPLMRGSDHTYHVIALFVTKISQSWSIRVILHSVS